jgi:hypothetical protein
MLTAMVDRWIYTLMEQRFRNSKKTMTAESVQQSRRVCKALHGPAQIERASLIG